MVKVFAANRSRQPQPEQRVGTTDQDWAAVQQQIDAAWTQQYAGRQQQQARAQNQELQARQAEFEAFKKIMDALGLSQTIAPDRIAPAFERFRASGLLRDFTITQGQNAVRLNFGSDANTDYIVYRAGEAEYNGDNLDMKRMLAMLEYFAEAQEADPNFPGIDIEGSDLDVARLCVACRALGIHINSPKLEKNDPRYTNDPLFLQAAQEWGHQAQSDAGRHYLIAFDRARRDGEPASFGNRLDDAVNAGPAASRGLLDRLGAAPDEADFAGGNDDIVYEGGPEDDEDPDEGQSGPAGAGDLEQGGPAPAAQGGQAARLPYPDDAGAAAALMGGYSLINPADRTAFSVPRQKAPPAPPSAEAVADAEIVRTMFTAFDPIYAEARGRFNGSFKEKLPAEFEGHLSRMAAIPADQLPLILMALEHRYPVLTAGSLFPEIERTSDDQARFEAMKKAWDSQKRRPAVSQPIVSAEDAEAHAAATRYTAVKKVLFGQIKNVVDRYAYEAGVALDKDPNARLSFEIPSSLTPFERTITYLAIKRTGAIVSNPPERVKLDRGAVREFEKFCELHLGGNLGRAESEINILKAYLARPEDFTEELPPNTHNVAPAKAMSTLQWQTGIGKTLLPGAATVSRWKNNLPGAQLKKDASGAYRLSGEDLRRMGIGEYTPVILAAHALGINVADADTLPLSRQQIRAWNTFARESNENRGFTAKIMRDPLLPRYKFPKNDGPVFFGDLQAVRTVNAAPAAKQAANTASQEPVHHQLSRTQSSEGQHVATTAQAAPEQRDISGNGDAARVLADLEKRFPLKGDRQFEIKVSPTAKGESVADLGKEVRNATGNGRTSALRPGKIPNRVGQLPGDNARVRRTKAAGGKQPVPPPA